MVDFSVERGKLKFAVSANVLCSALATKRPKLVCFHACSDGFTTTAATTTTTMSSDVLFLGPVADIR